MNRLAVICLLFSCLSTGYASNILRELQYAEEIESSYSTGKVLWLQAQKKQFLALYTETEELDNLGTAIILHPMGGHPDQKKVINPLRTYLPDHNWATLSIQLPVLSIGAEKEAYYALFDDAKERIQVSLDFLRLAEVKNIVLVGYGLGGVMAVYFVREGGAFSEVDAMVAISLSVPDSERQQVQIIDFIGDIRKPFLDIFAEFDLPEVTDSARKRRIAGKASLAYRQFQIEGEGHLFQHDEGLLVKRIYSWINKTFRKQK